MTGRRLWLTVAGVVVLAVLAVVALVVGSGEDDDDDGTSTSTTVSRNETLPDEVVAGTLLPAVSALGSNWIETARDDDPTEATITQGDACPSGPIPDGWLIRGEQRRVENGGSTISETLSVTAGVVAPGVEPADLADPTIVSCLLDGLQAQLPATSTVEAVDGPLLGPTPPGAVVSHQRFQITGEDGTGGTFDFLLVRRGRAVSLGLLTGFGVTEPTDLGAVVTALDAPLQAALPHLAD